MSHRPQGRHVVDELSRSERIDALRYLYRRGRLAVASSDRELREAARRGHAVDAHGVAELILAKGVLADRPVLAAS